MKYTIDEAFAEAMRRGKEIRERKNRRERRILAGTSVVLFALLVAAFCLLPDQGRKPGLVMGRLGATMFPAEMGGYVIVAVLSACLAVAVTLLCIKRRDQQGK